MREAGALPPSGRWARRLALATLLAILPLVAMGGTVTTLRAGLAIDGWWVLEPGRGDHFLLAYPWSKWTRDAGTFTEHSHRLLGVLVGVLAILHVAASFAGDRWRPARVLAVLALLAICLQGLLGGLRVLEKSDPLAFLHGVLGQGVLALVGACAIAAHPAYRSLPRTPCGQARSLRRTGLALVAVVYAQIALGAWLRHSGSHVALGLHILAVLLVALAVMAAARRLRLSALEGAAAGVDRSVLSRVRRLLLALFAAQVVLGILATAAVLVLSGGFHGEVSVGEMIFATAHVLLGALLLLASVAAWMWGRRLTASPAGAPALQPATGGAR